MAEAAKIVKPKTKAGCASLKEVVTEPEVVQEVGELPQKPARYYFNIYEHREPQRKDVHVASLYYDEVDNDVHIEHIVSKGAKLTTILTSDYQLPGTTICVSRAEETKEWALNLHKAGDLLENLRATETVLEYNY